MLEVPYLSSKLILAHFGSFCLFQSIAMKWTLKQVWYIAIVMGMAIPLLYFAGKGLFNDKGRSCLLMVIRFLHTAILICLSRNVDYRS